MEKENGKPLKRIRSMIGSWAIMFFAFFHPYAVYAATDNLDLLVIAKALPLLSEKLNGIIKCAIFFDPSNASSRQEAEGIKSSLSNHFEVAGDIQLVPVLVPITDLKTATDSKMAILTTGLEQHFDAINQLASSQKILTASTDLECVRTHKCILGIVSRPRVEIFYSPSAASAAGISFGSTFLMLVKPI